MTPSTVSGRRLRQALRSARWVALAPAGLALLLLAGCTSEFLGEGGAPTAQPNPSPSETATATPTAEPTQPAAEFDCDGVLINRPGNYVLGECGTVTLEGDGIDLTLTSVANLVIRGDNADVVADRIGGVEIDGQGIEIAAITIRSVTIRGNQNVLTAEETIGTVRIDGNENIVTAGEGVGPTIDNGLLNEVTAAG